MPRETRPMNTLARTRIAEAAMAILQATPSGQLGITVMNKALFYADLCALRDLGETITRSGYIALPQGPVLNHYERSLIKKLERLGFAEQTTDGWEKPLVARQKADPYELLTDEEVGIAQLVSRKIHGKSAAWVSEYSHENEAWISAFRAGTGTNINLLIALQQVIEDDPWVGEPADGEVTRVFDRGLDDSGVPF
jgi:hypothetical protein